MQVVTSYLMGGLGNQLFQIFATLAYAIRTKRKAIFPYSEKLNIGIVRDTYWNSFLYELKHMTTFNKANGYDNQRLMNFDVVYREEDDFTYKDIPEITHVNELMLFGYFQSPKYFQHQFDKITSMIGIPELKEKNKQEFPQYYAEDAILISMHFRLGDYKKKQDCHPILPFEYYKNALMHLLMHSQLYKKVNVLYFCEKEDNEIVNNSIKKLEELFHDFTFVKVDDKIEDWKQMLIMSNCHHNIIANSSFSWWGAYLNFYSNKIVCYPSLWFGPSIKATTEYMFPEDWTKITI